MNHCEFLKTLPDLGKDDIELLKAIIGSISCVISILLCD